MNRIYKVIWSKAKSCYVVVSELATSHTRAKASTGGKLDLYGLARLAVVFGLTSGLFFPTMVEAVVQVGSTGTNSVTTSGASATKTAGIAIGENAETTVEGGIAIGANAGKQNTSAVNPNPGTAPREWEKLYDFYYYERRNIPVVDDKIKYNTIAIGTNAYAQGHDAIAIGTRSQAINDNIGHNATPLAIGYQALATGDQTVALGSRAMAKARQSMAIGNDTSSNGYGAISIGGDDSGPGTSAYSQPNALHTTGAPMMKYGYIRSSGQWKPTATVGNAAVAIGVHGQALSMGSAAIGVGATAGDGNIKGDLNAFLGNPDYNNLQALDMIQRIDHKEATAIGAMSHAATAGSTAIGRSADAHSKRSLAIGYNASTLGATETTDTTDAVAIGSNSKAAGVESISIGTTATAMGDKNMAIGRQAMVADTAGTDNIVVGSSTIKKGTRNIIVGSDASIEAEKGTSVAIGDKSKVGSAVKSDGLAVGSLSTNNGAFGGTALGAKSLVSGNFTTAIGYQAGSQSTATTDAKGQIDTASLATSDESIYIGKNAGRDVKGSDNVIIGNYDKGGNPTAANPNAGLTEAGANAGSFTGITVVGREATSLSNKGVTVGYKSSVGANSDSAIAIGDEASAKNAPKGIAIGKGAKAEAEDAISIGTGNTVSGAHSGAIGDPTTITGTGTYTIGNNNGTVAADNSGAFGNNNVFTGAVNNVRMIGNNNTVSADNAMILGNNAKVSAAQAVAVGEGANAGTVDSIAMGSGAVTNGANVVNRGGSDQFVISGGEIAIGKGAASKNIESIAIGKGAESTGRYSVAIGGEQTLYNTAGGIVESTKTTATEFAVAVGPAATAKDFSTALGYQASASGISSTAIGKDATVETGANYGLALGSNTKVSVENSVAIGDYSSATEAVVSTPSATINGQLRRFAGGNATGTVSVGHASVAYGDDDTYRTVTHVAAGRISATSTDAINGSQLFAVTDTIDKGIVYAGDVKAAAAGTNDFTRKLGEKTNIVGGVATEADLTDNNIGVVSNGMDTLTVKLKKDVDLGANGSLKAGGTIINNGGISTNGLNMNNNQITGVASGGTTGTNAANIDDVTRIAGANEKTTTVVQGKNTTVTSKVVGNNTEYTVNAEKTTVSTPAGSGIDVTANADANTGITDYAIKLSQATKDDIQKGVDAKTKVDTDGLTFTGDAGTTTGVKKLGDTVAVTGDANITSTALNAGIAIALKKDLTGLTSAQIGGTTINNSGIDNGGNVIKNVASGNVNNDATDNNNAATIGDLKNAVAAGAYSWKLSDGSATENNVATGSTVKIKGSANGAPATTVGVTTAINGNDITVDLSQKTKDDIQKGVDAKTATDKGTVYAGDVQEAGAAANPFKRELGQQTNIKGGITDLNNLTDDNIGVVSNGTDTLTVKLAKKIKLGADGEVSFDTTKFNKDGVVVGNTNVGAAGVTTDKVTVGPVVIDKNTGINAGDKQVTNVASGLNGADLATASGNTLKNAVNVGDLQAAVSGAANKGLQFGANSGADVTNKLGSKVTVKGEGTKADADYSGANIKTKVSQDASGNTTIDVMMDKNLNVESVTATDAAGNTNVTNATSNTITDKASGNSTKTTADGVTASDKDGKKTAALTNEGLIVKNTDTGKTVSVTADGLDNGGNIIKNVASGNVNNNDTDNNNAANIGDVKKAVASATTKVADGKNTNVTFDTNPDGSKTYKVNLNDDSTLGTDPDKQVRINGNAGTVTAGTGDKAVTIDGTNGSVKAGKVTVGGNTGTVNGLTNKTWDVKTSVPVSGQAATEDQLKSVSDVVNQNTTNIAKNKAELDKGLNFTGDDTATVVNKKLGEILTIKGGADANALSEGNIGVVADNGALSVRLAKDIKGIDSITTNADAAGNKTTVSSSGVTISNGGGNSVTLTSNGLNNGGNKITGVEDGIVAPGSKDAVNGGQLHQVASAVEGIGDEVRQVGALGAALSALKPIQYDPLEPTQIMAGVGAYRSSTAVALGLAHYKNESMLLHAGVSYAGGGDNHLMANAGVTWKFGNRSAEASVPDMYRRGPISSTYAIQDQVKSLQSENAGLREKVNEQQQTIDKILGELEAIKSQISK